MSRLKINLEKSAIIPIGRVDDVEALAVDLGCKVGNLPSTYLGLPLGVQYKPTGAWDGVAEQFRKRLTLWKRQYISKEGRAALLKSTLSSLPIYFLSLFHIPRSIHLRLDQI